MVRLFLGLAGASGAIAVAAGALASHGLASRLSPEAIAVFQTGVRYQMYHAIALLAVALLLATAKFKALPLIAAGAAFVVGAILFSGSLYLISGLGVTSVGILTPIGGVILIGGWCCLIGAAFSQ
ncbi:MAG: DUF423 domain-containing protein [Synechococcales bacterium]|nr:DUF423 domain-containing protein [Synechococcales bacterium]